MRKKGGILLIIGVILIVLIAIIAGAAFYFYNFHVFKKINICIGADYEDLLLDCSSEADCGGRFEEIRSEVGKNLEGAPLFVGERIEEVYSKAFYCDGTCKVKEIRGLENLEEETICLENEEEVSIEIRGKEGLALLTWMKENGKI
jgi:hypothetical protein